MILKSAQEIGDITTKRVLLRLDTDVDIENGAIVDDTRLKAGLETLNLLLSRGADVIIIGHLGRPTGADNAFSLEIVAKYYAPLLNGSVTKTTLSDFTAFQIAPHAYVLENIRFYKEEEENDPEFAKKLASLADYYVNDAFAVSHRAHASIEAITHLLPSYAGLHLVKEVEVLGKVMENPTRPLVVLIGGAKIETKLPMVEKMHHVADYVLVGGEIAEQDKVLIQVQHEKLEGPKSVVLVAEMNESGFDITPKSVENFLQIIGLAKTIVWNGPVGLIGKEAIHEEGTKRLAEGIVATDAYKIVGGGDSLSYLKRIGLLDKFDFVSTGGGAMLEFMSGKELPGIKPLLLN